ncbi:MAG: lipid carrier--UDP-N-acetylgalactosaminyltransferase [Bacteroidetes bacterium HGW-Bacteroidetes-19]|nr:MAG: lipid carrier--UDP-N-acetylgalactosaminyltransferase [Bacteroidetes bacterium HGW-Bacteroidetes-19]
MKRSSDIVFSFIAILFLTPIWFPIIIILLLTGEHLVFYFQKRIGRGGEPFGVWKFVTMVTNSVNIGTGSVTTVNDPRVLPVGKFLRKSKLNELPQLINILIGNMSFIGPRPLLKCDFDAYSTEAQKKVIQSKPGLSGIGSIVFRDEEVVVSKAKEPIPFFMNVIQPFKGELEIWYFYNRSISVDFKIIILTILGLFFPKSELVYKIFPTLPKKDFEDEVVKFNETYLKDIKN